MSRPDACAVRCDGEGISWSELVRQSNGLAYVLRDAGLDRGDRVAVLLPKSLQVAAAFYGVSAAGGALVPLDPKAPAEQLQRVLRATGATQLIMGGRMQTDLSGLLANCPELRHVIADDVDESLPVAVTPWAAVHAMASDCAPDIPVGGLDTSYIQHTSGSTGEPKLIRHTHASALAFVEWAVSAYGIHAQDRLSNHSSHHTCFATFDYYAAARAGATTVVLTPAAMMMPPTLSALLESERVSIWYSVPTALVQLLLRGTLQERQLDALRWVLFAGERFPEKHLRSLMKQLPRARFSHVYGSTEVNVCSYYHLPEEPQLPDPLPIGVPCSNTRALVVDPSGRPVAAGESGELLVQGSTLMSGYWGDPERNRQVLLERPAAGGLSERWYRTGDRVLQLPDGTLAFGGREDRQVKIRGHRVELDEVEHALMAQDSVLEAVALTQADDEDSQQVSAVVVLDPASRTDVRELLVAVGRLLPRHAVPASLISLQSLPRTPTGKVDRRQLAVMLTEAAAASPDSTGLG